MKINRWLCALVILCSACQKTEYNVIDGAAYLRVFNSLNYDVTISNKDQDKPFLTMIIDPTYDDKGAVTGGKVVGDFLDQRSPYAPPYPASAGTTSFRNPEYPGYEKVAVGPILNGINLSSWAQVQSGKHRVLFFNRPISPTSFFQLENRDRHLLVDSTVNFTSGEVYTMEVLQQHVTSDATIPVTLYLRQEQFTKQPFSDSMLYVNFYNMSAEGYAQAHPNKNPQGVQAFYNTTNRTTPFGDTMNIFYNLYHDDCAYPYVANAPTTALLISGYNNVWLGTLIRSQDNRQTPYYSMPMFAGKDTTGGILSRQWELFILMAPGLTPAPGILPVQTTNGMVSANISYGAIGCSNISNDGRPGLYARSIPHPQGQTTNYIASCWLPNLIRYTASGPYAQRSFATISTIEVINNYVYMMSVQRSYAPPSN